MKKTLIMIAAVAASAFSLRAEEANIAAMWNNNGNPSEAGKTPLDFGWQGWDGNFPVTDQFWEYGHAGGTRFRDGDNNYSVSRPHLLLHFQTTGVTHFAYPLETVEAGATYEVNVTFHRHNNEDEYLGIGVSATPNNTGKTYYESTNATPQGEWETKRFYFTATDADQQYYLTFYRPQGTMNLVAVSDISVVKSGPFSLDGATRENPLDITRLYMNNSGFEALTSGDNSKPNNWSVTDMASQSNSDFEGKEGIYYMEKWVSSTGNLPDVSIRRTLSGLKKGLYRLTAAAMNRKVGQVTHGAWLYAGDAKTEVADPDDYSVEFALLSDDSSIEVGLRTTGSTGNWVAVDNFRLEYLGEAAGITKTLTVKVSDAKGAAVANAEVALNNGATPAMTNAAGSATITFDSNELDGLVLSVKKEGYAEYTAPVVWGGSPSLTMNVTLLDAQPLTGNLLANALRGNLGTYPAGWVNYNREGEELGERGLATLRDASGGSTGSGTPVFLMLRWDDVWDNVTINEAYDAHNRYYAYQVIIPETGLYNFSMDCVQWSEWKGLEGNEGSQVPEKSAVRVTLAPGKGYNYMMSQSHVFDMNEDNPGNASDKSTVKWNTCKGKFFAKAGTYYLSFTGSHGLYPVKNLSLVKDEESTLTELPQSRGMDIDVAIDEEMRIPVGGYDVRPADGAAVEYVFNPDNNNPRNISTYATLDNIRLTEQGVLYMYDVIDGVHSDVAFMDVAINKPEMNFSDLVLGEGMEREDEEIVMTVSKGEISFNTPDYMDIYARMSVENGNLTETFRKVDGPLVIEKSGRLEFYPSVKDVDGDVLTLQITKDLSGIESISIEDMENGDVELYDLNGVRVNRACNGVYIMRRNGRAIKIRIS